MSYVITSTIDVVIINQSDRLSNKFLAWVLSNDIKPVRGGYLTFSGYWGVFDKQDEEAIEKFFAEHG